MQFSKGDVIWYVAMRPRKHRAPDLLRDTDCLSDKVETIKARIRAKVEHIFRLIKYRLGLNRVSYRRSAKNTEQPTALFGLANLMIEKRRLGKRIPRARRDAATKREIVGGILKGGRYLQVSTSNTRLAFTRCRGVSAGDVRASNTFECC